jgi:hypothetical protein
MTTGIHWKQTLSKAFFAAWFFAGWAGVASGGGLFGSDIKPDNVFKAGPALPASVKRVVVLPLAREDSRADFAGGCEMLDPVLQSELIQTKKFEVVTIGPKQLQGLTGELAWTGTEELPGNFFDSLRRAYACDAVLFCQLTTFHPYAPLAVGWRMKLVDVSTQKIIWAADMVYDAGNAGTAREAQQFQKQQQGVPAAPRKFFQRVTGWIYHDPPPATEDQWTILNSPRYFGQFSVAKLLQTLPAR